MPGSMMEPIHARLLPLQCCKICLDLIVLSELGLDIVIDTDELLQAHISYHHCYIEMCLTFCKESIISTRGLSARYLTLFQVKVRKYWSAGSMKDRQLSVSFELIAPMAQKLTIIYCLLLGNLLFVAF